MKPLLVVDCVSKSYRGRPVLSVASLQAVPGELRVLLGRNGAGKSTLLKIACGWLQPDSGLVHYDGSACPAARLRDLATRGVFYLPDRDLFSSAFTVGAQLEMIRLRFAGAACEDSAARMGIGGRLDQRRSELSSGEVRRAELAAVLVRRPRCVLADEPFRGIGPKETEELAHALRGVAASGVAVVVAGQDPKALLPTADHVTWCTDGTTHELGPPADAEHNEVLRREYLDLYQRRHAI